MNVGLVFMGSLCDKSQVPDIKQMKKKKKNPWQDSRKVCVRVGLSQGCSGSINVKEEG